MRHFLLLIGVLCFTESLYAAESPATPLDVVKKRMRALNNHNLDMFLSTYAEDVEIYVYPERSLGKGKQHLQKLFAPMLEKGEVHVKLGKTMSADSFVVVESTTSFGDRTEHGVAIYEVRGGLIRSVRFLRDELRATQVRTKKPSGE